MPYVQSGCWYCQSNTSKLNLGNIFTYNLGLMYQMQEMYFQHNPLKTFSERTIQLNLVKVQQNIK